MPKLRIRGLRLKELASWFDEQGVDPSKYRADFVPHSENSLWATTFVVNAKGIYGEIIRGSHSQLTQGFREGGAAPITFAYQEFEKWELSQENDEALAECQKIASCLRVSDQKSQDELRAALEAQFTGNYLCGYFESVTSEEYGLWFIDYNRVLGSMYQDFSIVPRAASLVIASEVRVLRGQTGNPGKAAGKAEVVFATQLGSAAIEVGDILVCDMTTPDFIPLMKSAAAIVTNLGGILSHAAIVARELKKPCVVGTGNATTIIHKGETVEVDADRGLVTIC